MNNHPLRSQPSKYQSFVIIALSSLFRVSVVTLIFAVAVFAQASVWRYVTTIPGGVKAYLNDEIKFRRRGK